MSDELKDIIKGTKLPLDKDTLAVSGELNKLIPRLSLNGNKFRKMMGSEEVAVAPTQHLNVVIIKMAHTPSRVAVVLANDLEGDIIQVVLPAMSCFGKEKQGRWPFRPYIQMLANNSVSAGRVVTKLQFDEEVNIPKLLFSPVAAIKEHDMEVLKMRSEDSAALQAITLRVKPPHEAEPNRPTVQFDVFLETPAEPSSKQIERDEEVSDIIKRWTNKNGS